MTLERLVARIMRLAARRPVAVGGGVLLVALAAAVLALATLSPSASTDTLVDGGSPTAQASERYREAFGEDAIYVLVRQPLQYTVLSSDLQRVVGLEGCISGNVPEGTTPRGGWSGPCGRLGRTKPVKVVFGPGTFLNESVGQIQTEFQRQNAAAAQRAEQAATAARELAKERGWSRARQDKAAADARELVNAEYTKTLVQLALRYQITSVPQLNDPNFIATIVFDEAKPAGTPKARFAYLFPTRDAALIQVRLKPGLSDDQRRAAIDDIRAATQMRDWRLTQGRGAYVVTGAPVLVGDLATSISRSIVLLVGGALLVMALVLALVLRERRRLVPLLVAVAATAITFGGLALVGAPLTMAAVGVLPILIGLAVDYAVQLQSRLGEEDGDVEAVARRGAPTIAIAATATAVGFLVLLVSPVPQIRGFGLLLVFGVAVALLCALTLGVAAWSWRPAPGARRPGAALAGRISAAPLPALRGARDLAADNPVSRAVLGLGRRTARGALGAATRHPGRVLAVGFAAAVLGWGLDTQSRVESDVQKLVPQDLPALRDLNSLEASTGVGGEVDVVVSGKDLTDPAVITWMTRYQADLLKRFDYSAERGCGKADLCPAFSLPDLFRSGPPASREQVRTLLDAVPPYFSQGVMTAARDTAVLAFGVRLMSLERQQEVFDVMRERLAAIPPPEGTSVELTGLPVLAAEANAEVSSPWRRLVMWVLGLVAVALTLLLAFRSRRRALVPLIPIAMATGWSALVVFLTRVPLNPMSVTLSVLVIAIATEFSVLLSERYRAEREAGHEPEQALERTYRSTGRAVVISGITALAGFAVLVLSDIAMLRNFGAVTVLDLGVSLIGVLVVLPSALVLAERRGLRLGRPTPRRRRSPSPAPVDRQPVATGG